MDIDLDKIRTENFLRIYRTKYRGSPSRLERETGFSANMASQIAGGHKFIGDKLARKLEREYLRIPLGTLDRIDPEQTAQRRRSEPQYEWPFDVPQSEFESLSPKAKEEIKNAVTRMILGAQAEQLLSRQRKRG